MWARRDWAISRDDGGGGSLRFGRSCFLVLEGMALEHVYHKAIGCEAVRITAKTQGDFVVDYANPRGVGISKLVGQLFR